jgi:Sap, sulfolipid-1-addressing protein
VLSFGMIWQALGSVLGQAMGVALSPAAIIAVTLVLFSAKAKLNSLLVLAAWFIAVTAAFILFGMLADGADVSDPDSGGSTGFAVVQILLGLLFLALAAKQWRGRPTPGAPAKPNKLFDKVADMGPGLAFGLGILMSAVNPKNLTLIVSAAGEVARTGISDSDLVIVAILFAIISMVGVGAPVVLSLVMGDKATTTLTELRDWMIEHNTAIMIVLFVVLGAKTLGAGIGALAA